MTNDMTTTAYRLASTARILEDGDGRFRIRTGVWNYEEAVIDTSGESPAVGRTVSAALRELTGQATALAQHLDAELLPVERANIERLFADLEQSGILVTEGRHRGQDAITAALLGRLVSPVPGATEPPNRPVMFLSDSPAATAQAHGLADGLRIRLSQPDDAVVTELSTADLTSRTNGYDTERAVERLRPVLAEPAALVTCFQRPSLRLLRNINRVIEGADIPWISSFIDGPFVSVVGLKSPHTGCFECFEQRALARLEDHVAYHDFARANPAPPQADAADAPLMALVTVLALTEGYLHAAVGTSRFSGRVLGIHLPTMEIQTQDLLRMPNCPACGRVSRQRLKEIGFNSRAAVDRIVSQVLN